MKWIPPVVTAVMLAAAIASESAAAPPVPPGQVQVRIMDGALQVNWQRSPDDPLYVSGYEVVRGLFPSGPYQQLCVTLKGAISCTDRNAQPERQYYYKVRSIGIGDDGASPFTAHVTGQLPRSTMAER